MHSLGVRFDVAVPKPVLLTQVSAATFGARLTPQATCCPYPAQAMGSPES